MENNISFYFTFLAQTHILALGGLKFSREGLFWARETHFLPIFRSWGPKYGSEKKIKIITPFLFRFQGQFLFYISASDPYFDSQGPEIVIAKSVAQHVKKNSFFFFSNFNLIFRQSCGWPFLKNSLICILCKNFMPLSQIV